MLHATHRDASSPEHGSLARRGRSDGSHSELDIDPRDDVSVSSPGFPTYVTSQFLRSPQAGVKHFHHSHSPDPSDKMTTHHSEIEISLSSIASNTSSEGSSPFMYGHKSRLSGDEFKTSVRPMTITVSTTEEPPAPPGADSPEPGFRRQPNTEPLNPNFVNNTHQYLPPPSPAISISLHNSVSALSHVSNFFHPTDGIRPLSECAAELVASVLDSDIAAIVMQYAEPLTDTLLQQFTRFITVESAFEDACVLCDELVAVRSGQFISIYDTSQPPPLNRCNSLSSSHRPSVGSDGAIVRVSRQISRFRWDLGEASQSKSKINGKKKNVLKLGCAMTSLEIDSVLSHQRTSPASCLLPSKAKSNTPLEALSPLLVVAQYDGTVQLWSAKLGKLWLSFPAYNHDVEQIHVMTLSSSHFVTAAVYRTGDIPAVHRHMVSVKIWRIQPSAPFKFCKYSLVHKVKKQVNMLVSLRRLPNTLAQHGIAGFILVPVAQRFKRHPISKAKLANPKIGGRPVEVEPSQLLLFRSQVWPPHNESHIEPLPASFKDTAWMPIKIDKLPPSEYDFESVGMIDSEIMGCYSRLQHALCLLQLTECIGDPTVPAYRVPPATTPVNSERKTPAPPPTLPPSKDQHQRKPTAKRLVEPPPPPPQHVRYYDVNIVAQFPLTRDITAPSALLPMPFLSYPGYCLAVKPNGYVVICDAFSGKMLTRIPVDSGAITHSFVTGRSQLVVVAEDEDGFIVLE